MKVYEIWRVEKHNASELSPSWVSRDDAIDYAIYLQKRWDDTIGYPTFERQAAYEVREIEIKEKPGSNPKKFEMYAGYYNMGEYTELGSMAPEEIEELMNEEDKSLGRFQKSIKSLCLDLKKAGFDPLDAIVDQYGDIISAIDVMKQREYFEEREKEE